MYVLYKCNFYLKPHNATLAVTKVDSFPLILSEHADILIESGGGREYLPIHLDQVECTGQESALLECPSQPVGVHNCVHPEDVTITCTDGVCKLLLRK